MLSHTDTQLIFVFINHCLDSVVDVKMKKQKNL